MPEPLQNTDPEPIEISREAEDALLHTLGLGEECHKPSRNRFVCGSPPRPAVGELVVAGLMAEYLPTPGFLGEGSHLYMATEAGRAVALDCLARREAARPQLTRGQVRYRAWLDFSDASDLSFGDWLRRGCRP